MDNRTLRLLEYDKIRERLLPHAATVLGKEHVERMRPSRDVTMVQSRLGETDEARRMIEEHGSAPFDGLRDVREPLLRAEKQGVLTATELQDVADTAAGLRRLRHHLHATAPYFTALKEQGKLLSEFRGIERAVDEAIGNNGEVLDAASPDLGAARRKVRRMHEEIQRELQRLITSPAMLEKLQEPIVTQRNGRFCVPVRAEERNAFKGIVHDLSASGQTAFMEPLSVVELGNDLREAQRREEEEIYRVLAALSAQVGKVAGTMKSSLEASGRLDMIFARAHFANALRATAPLLNTDGIIALVGARHPLLGDIAVPIDVAFGEEGVASLIITGPNTGGKTVTLKTVGLLCAMAQSGMHIPAEEGSRLPLFEQIFADIGDEQSIEQSLSTFSGHMTNIVKIIGEAKGRALVLLDEVGAGTDPTEGAALAKAILLELNARGCRTIATTHYGELKVFAQTTEGFCNASVEFDLETLRPTYRVITGLPGSSNALSISGRLGLPKSLIAHARELMGEAPQAFEQVLKQAEGARRALDRERSAAARSRQDAERTVEALKQQQRELDEKREASLARARVQAQDVLQKARQEANGLLEELRLAIREARAQADTHQGPNLSALRRRAREVLDTLTESVEELPEVPPAPKAKTPDRPALTEVRAGQQVLVHSLGHRGIVLGNAKGNELVEVQVGIMRKRVPLSDLEPAAPVAAAFSAPRAPAQEPARQVAPELHLLGLRAEEAAERLEEYLYDALELGLSSVRIVHGFGTGALRGMVQDVVRHHPAVRSARAGGPGEGGGGVTIAEIAEK
ncbi:MAG: endonuclease MutS2 [Armatimonadota bacterium]